MFLLIPKFIYRIFKNISRDYRLFVLHFRYYLLVFLKDKVDLSSKSQLADKLNENMRNLTIICW